MTLKRKRELRSLFDTKRIWMLESGELNNIIEECLDDIDTLQSAARLALQAGSVGDSRVVCPRVFLEPLRALFLAVDGEVTP